jgi:hypothetical protein
MSEENGGISQNIKLAIAAISILAIGGGIWYYKYKSGKEDLESNSQAPTQNVTPPTPESDAVSLGKQIAAHPLSQFIDIESINTMKNMDGIVKYIPKNEVNNINTVLQKLLGEIVDSNKINKEALAEYHKIFKELLKDSQMKSALGRFIKIGIGRKAA